MIKEFYSLTCWKLQHRLLRGKNVKEKKRLKMKKQFKSSKGNNYGIIQTLSGRKL